MMFFNTLTNRQKKMIQKAYDFEISSIELASARRNPYKRRLEVMGLWEAIEEAVEMAFN